MTIRSNVTTIVVFACAVTLAAVGGFVGGGRPQAWRDAAGAKAPAGAQAKLTDWDGKPLPSSVAPGGLIAVSAEGSAAAAGDAAVALDVETSVATPLKRWGRLYVFNAGEAGSRVVIRLSVAKGDMVSTQTVRIAVAGDAPDPLPAPPVPVPVPVPPAPIPTPDPTPTPTPTPTPDTVALGLDGDVAAIFAGLASWNADQKRYAASRFQAAFERAAKSPAATVQAFLDATAAAERDAFRDNPAFFAVAHDSIVVPLRNKMRDLALAGKFAQTVPAHVAAWGEVARGFREAAR